MSQQILRNYIFMYIISKTRFTMTTNTLLLSSQECPVGEFSIGETIDGEYELIHQYIEYHEPDAVDYTCNRIWWETSSEIKSYDDLSDQTTMNAATIASELDSDFGEWATVTSAADGSYITINADGTEDLTIFWTESSAKILFKHTGQDDTIEIGNSKRYYIRDRTTIKHYTMSIDEAFYGITTTSSETPTLLLSAYEDVIAGQRMRIPQEVSTLNYTVREYGSLVDLNDDDVPELHLFFKKIS